jgi:hypothetical protein
VRIRIIRAQYGNVDGVSLAGFNVGETYDLPPTIASYLIALGAADPLFAHATAGEPAAEAASTGSASAAIAAAMHSTTPQSDLRRNE